MAGIQQQHAKQNGCHKSRPTTGIQVHAGVRIERPMKYELVNKVAGGSGPSQTNTGIKHQIPWE